jgi:hypothetical protein
LHKDTKILPRQLALPILLAILSEVPDSSAVVETYYVVAGVPNPPDRSTFQRICAEGVRSGAIELPSFLHTQLKYGTRPGYPKDLVWLGGDMAIHIDASDPERTGRKPRNGEQEEATTSNLFHVAGKPVMIIARRLLPETMAVRTRRRTKEAMQ